MGKVRRKVRRSVRYYIETDTAEQVEGDMRHQWTVAIVNDSREAARITERLLKELAICGNIFERYNTTVSGSGGLSCKIFTFDSATGKLEYPNKVYMADIRPDRRLSNLPDNGLENYVRSITS